MMKNIVEATCDVCKRQDRFQNQSGMEVMGWLSIGLDNFTDAHICPECAKRIASLVACSTRLGD